MPESLQKTLKKVEGWLDSKEATFLYTVAKKGPENGEIVEIGSWKGKSTICLAKGSKEALRERVHAIDPHTSDEYNYVSSWEGFSKNIARSGVSDWVIPTVKTSEHAHKNWKKGVRFLWIDGSHKYYQVKKDIVMWEPHLVEGGIIALHDTVWMEGPSRASERYVIASRKFKKIGFVGNITFGIKSKEISKIDIVVNYWKRMLKKTMILVYKIDRLKERKEHYFIRPLLERLVERYPDSW